MRGVKRFTSRMLAIMLAGALTVGNLSVSAFGTEIDVTVADTSEMAAEEVVSEAEDTVIEEVIDSEAVTSYTVTLDANRGYFENEWDDAIGEYSEQTEVVERHIPVDGTVNVVPMFNNSDGQSMVFAGWSLERDGELVSPAEEEYVPVDNCTLYAVWRAEDAALLETGEQEIANEGTEQEDLGQEATEEAESVEGTEAGNDVTEMIEEIETSEESDTVEGAKESGDVESEKVTQEHGVTEDTDTAKEFEDSETAEKAETVQETTEDTENAEEESKNTKVEEDSRDTEVAKETKTTQEENDVEETVSDMNTGLDSDDDSNEFFEDRTYNTSVSFAGGNGTQIDPYQIKTAEQLDAVRNDLSAYYILVDNIDIGSYNWKSIGNVNEGFEGEFDGNGYSINNLTIQKQDGVSIYGLFNITKGTVKNVTLQNCDVNIQSLGSVDIYNPCVGTLCGREYEYGKIYNCKTYGTINVSVDNSAFVGGVVGYGENDISGCENHVDIIVTTPIDTGQSGAIQCGGIVGDNGNISHCSNYGKINASGNSFCYCGGISGKDGLISECINYGSISGSIMAYHGWSSFAGNCNVGGIVGATSFDVLDKCINYGSISASKTCENGSCYSGGVAGFVGYYSSGSITNCINAGPQIYAKDGSAGRVAGCVMRPDNLYSLSSTLCNGEIPSTEKDVTGKNGQDIDESELEGLINSIIYGMYIASGRCGENLTWILDEAGTLSISGTGPMFNYDYSPTPWNIYKNDINNIIFEENVTSIGSNAFSECNNLKELTIPSGVFNVYTSAFYGCTELETINILDGVSSISNAVFEGCKKISEVELPASLRSIGNSTFAYCGNLRKIVIDGCCSLPDYAFTNCTNLSEIFFKGSYASIGYAFYNVTATAYYPANDPTWTEDVRQNYGGTITWVPWNPGTDPITCPFRMTAPGFVTPRDVFSFTNSVKDIGINAEAPYPINYEWYHFFEERHFTVSEVKSILRKCTSFGGVCAGMTSIIMQNYLGLFYPVSVQSDAKSLNDINSPSTNSKIQTLIGINQYCLINDSYNIKQHNFQKENNGKDTLRLLCSLARNIEETSKPIYVDFCFLKDYSSWQKDNSKGCGAHAMLVYGIESSESYYEINDKKYKYRLLTINPNYQYVGDDIGEDYCIYISETYDSCVIPKSGTMQDNVNNGVLSYCGKEENFKKTNDFYFQYITNDINDILPTGTEIASELNPYFIFTGSLLESVTINKKPLAESDRVIGIVHSPFGSFSDSPTYILDKGECTIKLPQKNEITISGEDTFIIFNEDNGGELKIDNNNKISVSSEGAFSVSITSENLLLDNDDLVTFSIEGEKASNIQIDLSEKNGVKLNGTIDSGTVLKYSSIDYSEEYTYNVADSISNIFVSVDEDIVIGDVDISSGSCGENVIWKLNGAGTLTISGSGPMEDFAYSSATPWYGKTINSVVIGDGITRIGDYAFYDSAMTNLSLPDSLESIGCFSFSGLTGLNTINIPRGVTSIDQGAFAGSSYKANTITSITVDESNSAYSENDGVVYSKDGSVLVVYPPGRWGEFSVPEGVQEIGDSAFSGCKGLTGILIPEGVTVIENLAFAATGMSDVTIPNTVQSIGESAFANCRELKSVSIEGSVKTLKQLTFNICYDLQTIYLPESIEKIEQNTFFDCRSLKDVYFSGSERTWSKVVIEQGKVYDTYILDATVHFAKENETIVLDESCVSIKIDDQIWTGKPLIPVVDVKYENESIIEGTDYEVSYANNTNVGTATVTITGAGYYTGTVSKTFKINAASITDATVIGVSNKTYTGSALTQNPTVTVGDKTLTKGTDYTVSYANNTNAGTATVTITGKNNYTGTKTATFKINKASQGIIAKSSSASVAIGKTAVISITGAKGTKSYKSSNTSIATVDSKTGKVTAKKVGTVKVTATSAATSNYNAASKTVTIKVIPAATSSITAANQATGIKLTWKKVTGATGYKVYRGSTLIKTIKSGSTVTCTDTKANTNSTKYTFKIIPTASTGNGTAKSLTTYRVARPAISSVKNSASKKMTVKWGKNAKANGYQIQYSTNKTFASGNKTATVTKAATVSKVIGSLTKGKTYYVRIRTYKTVGKIKYWSAWSAAKSVKISK